eukprot:11004712-Heterocapsa_arctica.AAC.1
MAKRPKDLPITCTGCPAIGTTRYWRGDGARLSDWREGKPLTSGRNKPRSGIRDQPEDPRLILRALRNQGEEARPVPGPDNRRPESPYPRDQGPTQTIPKRKWVPREVLP